MGAGIAELEAEEELDDFPDVGLDSLPDPWSNRCTIAGALTGLDGNPSVLELALRFIEDNGGKLTLFLLVCLQYSYSHIHYSILSPACSADGRPLRDFLNGRMIHTTY